MLNFRKLFIMLICLSPYIALIANEEFESNQYMMQNYLYRMHDEMFLDRMKLEREVVNNLMTEYPCRKNEAINSWANRLIEIAAQKKLITDEIDREIHCWVKAQFKDILQVNPRMLNESTDDWEKRLKGIKEQKNKKGSSVLEEYDEENIVQQSSKFSNNLKLTAKIGGAFALVGAGIYWYLKYKKTSMNSNGSSSPKE